MKSLLIGILFVTSLVGLAQESNKLEPVIEWNEYGKIFSTISRKEKHRDHIRAILVNNSKLAEFIANANKELTNNIDNEIIDLINELNNGKEVNNLKLVFRINGSPSDVVWNEYKLVLIVASENDSGKLYYLNYFGQTIEKNGDLGAFSLERFKKLLSSQIKEKKRKSESHKLLQEKAEKNKRLVDSLLEEL